MRTDNLAGRPQIFRQYEVRTRIIRALSDVHDNLLWWRWLDPKYLENQPGHAWKPMLTWLERSEFEGRPTILLRLRTPDPTASVPTELTLHLDPALNYARVMIEFEVEHPAVDQADGEPDTAVIRTRQVYQYHEPDDPALPPQLMRVDSTAVNLPSKKLRYSQTTTNTWSTSPPDINHAVKLSSYRITWKSQWQHFLAPWHVLVAISGMVICLACGAALIRSDRQSTLHVDAAE